MRVKKLVQYENFLQKHLKVVKALCLCYVVDVVQKNGMKNEKIQINKGKTNGIT